MKDVILIIATSLISGLLATLVTILWQKRTELRKNQLSIFETLMAHRYEISNEKNVFALNKIDIVFFKNKAVLEAYKNFKQEANDASWNKDKPNQIFDKYLRILEEMAKSLGYKNINWEVIKNYYFPEGLSSKIQEETLIRKAQLNNIIKPADTKNNTQTATSEQIGMQVALKILESPDGVEKLVELADKFNEHKPKTNKN